jgi:hypothetical protein
MTPTLLQRTAPGLPTGSFTTDSSERSALLPPRDPRIEAQGPSKARPLASRDYPRNSLHPVFSPLHPSLSGIPECRRSAIYLPAREALQRPGRPQQSSRYLPARQGRTGHPGLRKEPSRWTVFSPRGSSRGRKGVCGAGSDSAGP